MGRDKGGHTTATQRQFVRFFWASDQEGSGLQQANRHDQRKALFSSTCSNILHMTICSIDSANDTRRHPLRCRVCSPMVLKQPSKHEKMAYALMDDMHMAYATEVFIFDSTVDDPSFGYKVSSHPFDIVLTKYQLLIEVDGIQHFENKYHGKDCAEQLYRDAIINAAAIEGGWGLVRLHWADEEYAWRETILSALSTNWSTARALCAAAPPIHWGSIIEGQPYQVGDLIPVIRHACGSSHPDQFHRATEGIHCNVELELDQLLAPGPYALVFSCQLMGGHGGSVDPGIAAGGVDVEGLGIQPYHCLEPATGLAEECRAIRYALGLDSRLQPHLKLNLHPLESGQSLHTHPQEVFWGHLSRPEAGGCYRGFPAELGPCPIWQPLCPCCVNSLVSMAECCDHPIHPSL